MPTLGVHTSWSQAPYQLSHMDTDDKLYTGQTMPALATKKDEKGKKKPTKPLSHDGTFVSKSNDTFEKSIFVGC